MGGVLSTQSLLWVFLGNLMHRIAAGMVAGVAPMAAVVNWILKDGLGHLGSMVFSA